MKRPKLRLSTPTQRLWAAKNCDKHGALAAYDLGHAGCIVLLPVDTGSERPLLTIAVYDWLVGRWHNLRLAWSYEFPVRDLLGRWRRLEGAGAGLGEQHRVRVEVREAFEAQRLAGVRLRQHVIKRRVNHNSINPSPPPYMYVRVRARNTARRGIGQDGVICHNTSLNLL